MYDLYSEGEFVSDSIVDEVARLINSYSIKSLSSEVWCLNNSYMQKWFIEGFCKDDKVKKDETVDA